MVIIYEKKVTIHINSGSKIVKVFEKQYWDENYSDPDTMDGIGNAKEHAIYLKAYFDLDLIDISSIIDYGCGYGDLLKAFGKVFKPYKMIGVEPSEYAFNKLKKRKVKPVESTNLNLYNKTITEWFEQKKIKNFDLGICTSVFQYLEEIELEYIIPQMAKQVKYLYFTVPTNIELERQVDDLAFHDKYALRRKRKFYHDLLKKNFTVVSSRVLESKHFFSEEDTSITDLFFRF
jgi:2-polyprenyl-3-methyl-5-hydroxy-6-metoxy-1,4-benzoquinol methylase